MPIPKRNSSESESDFIGRCMHEIGNEYPQDQSLAICYQQLDVQLKDIKAESKAWLKTATTGYSVDINKLLRK